MSFPDHEMQSMMVSFLPADSGHKNGPRSRLGRKSRLKNFARNTHSPVIHFFVITRTDKVYFLRGYVFLIWKQEQTPFMWSAAGFDKVLIVCHKVMKSKRSKSVETPKEFISHFWSKGVDLQKMIKSKRSGIPKLCWADQVKFELGSNFGGQGKKKQNRQKCKIVFGNFWQNIDYIELKLFTESCLIHTYTLDFIGFPLLCLNSKMQSRANNNNSNNFAEFLPTLQCPPPRWANVKKMLQVEMSSKKGLFLLSRGNICLA